MKSVAESGLATTSGEMRTMPEKWPGLSAAVRMQIAPPCGKRGHMLGGGVGVGPLGPELLPWNRRPQARVSGPTTTLLHVSPGLSKRKRFRGCK